jgi:hypothetical protein
MLKRLGLTSMMVLGTAASAVAGTLATSPFSSVNFTLGNATCTAANVGDGNATVSVELWDGFNGLIASQNDVTLAAGDAMYGPSAPLSGNPTFCRFKFKGKVRGSFSYINGGTVVVIPATK